MNDLTILKFDDVSHAYHTLEKGEKGVTQALSHLTFEVKRGQFVGVIGPSGCGKSTILSLAAGLLTPSSGKVITEGKRCGYMLQKDELFPWRTIEKNILLPLEMKKEWKNKKKVLLLAEKYGLGGFLKSYPHQLSGGMRQRAALIRTLATDPDLLLLDEPFSALDYQTRLTVCDDVYNVIQSEQKTALLITHDIGEAISVSDSVIVLTSRPAHVKAIYTLPFDRKTTPIERRKDGRFSDWFELLWRQLNE